MIIKGYVKDPFVHCYTFFGAGSFRLTGLYAGIFGKRSIFFKFFAAHIIFINNGEGTIAL